MYERLYVNVFSGSWVLLCVKKHYILTYNKFKILLFNRKIFPFNKKSEVWNGEFNPPFFRAGEVRDRVHLFKLETPLNLQSLQVDVLTFGTFPDHFFRPSQKRRDHSNGDSNVGS